MHPLKHLRCINTALNKIADPESYIFVTKIQSIYLHYNLIPKDPWTAFWGRCYYFNIDLCRIHRSVYWARFVNTKKNRYITFKTITPIIYPLQNCINIYIVYWICIIFFCLISFLKLGTILRTLIFFICV